MGRGVGGERWASRRHVDLEEGCVTCSKLEPFRGLTTNNDRPYLMNTLWSKCVA